MTTNSFDLMKTQRWTSPLVNYWWYRKRYKCANLINRYASEIKANSAQLSPVFVDVGCGDGRDLFLYRNVLEKSCPGWNFIGVEGFPESVENFIANQKYYGSNNVEIISHNIAKSLPFENDQVDLLYCSEVIEHIENPELLLTEIKRVLKPNGSLILTTPNEPNLFQRSYWSSARKEQMKKGILDNDYIYKTVNINNEEVTIHGHISVKTIKEWDSILHNMGFQTIDYERGSSIYGHNAIFDHPWILAAFFLLEALLDTLPKSSSRNVSSELIGLYQIKNK